MLSLESRPLGYRHLSEWCGSVVYRLNYGTCFHLSPCPLCMMQRIWLALTALFAYASLAHNPR